MEPTGSQATVMVTDIIDITTTMKFHEKVGLELLQANGDIMEHAAQRQDGRIIKSIGDSFFIQFNDPMGAVRCILDVQKAVDVYNRSRRDEAEKLWVRMAVHQGDVVAAQHGLTGSAIDVSSRLLGMAPAGGACLLRDVYEAIRGKHDGNVKSLGLRRLPWLTQDAEVVVIMPGEAKRAAELPPPVEDLKAQTPVISPPEPKRSAAAPPREAPPARAALKPAAVSDWGGGSAMPANPAELVGKIVGPCRIEAVIGGGGMGVVYRGRHTRLERPVAIKVLLPSINRSTAAADSMLQEARVVARLDDPRVVQVYDVGRQGPLSFIVMQLIKGETLADRVQRQGTLPQNEALAIMREVLRGLAAAHKAGVVHRDLKPSNIMIDESGGVKLMDFGIAAATGKEDFAPEGSVSGSFDFMAPEQAFGARPDPRMDIYSFGATYFFALAGRPPYTGSNAMEVLVKHRDSPVPDVRQALREATPGIAQLLVKLMQKFPENRPADAEEVLKALDAPGIIFAVDVSGSPFKILPPPIEEAAGFSAEMPGLGLARGPATPVGARIAGLPPPPPPVDYFSGKVPPATWAILTAMLLIFTGASWTTVGHADWMAAGIAATAAAALFAFYAAGAWRRAAGPLLFAGACLCFFQFGARPAEPFPPPMPGIEVAVVATLGLLVGAVGLFLGFMERQPERGLSASLLAASGLILLLAGTARSLPDSIGWFDGIPQLLSAGYDGLAQSGGSWRWCGVAFFSAIIWVVRSSEFDESKWTMRKTKDGVILNWNK